MTGGWKIAAAVTACGLAFALTAAIYAVAILAFVLAAVLLAVGYRSFNDTVSQRAGVSLFAIAAMSYVVSAWSLPPVMAMVVNMDTLKPALLYPFVTGLRFIPIWILVLTYWVFLALRDDAGLRRAPSCAVPM